MENVCNQLSKLVHEMPKELLCVIDSVYLYGSMARGDAFNGSDCDLLIVVNDCSEEVYNKIKKATSLWNSNLMLEVAIYQMSLLKKMQEIGSLFLWHIKLEAKKVYSNGDHFTELLSNLADYSNSGAAITEYREIMNDIINDNADDADVIAYNLSIMATLIRNTCIICCSLIGNKQFGRVLPVVICRAYFQEQFPINIEDYEEMYMYRIAINRGGKLPKQLDLINYYNDWKNKTDALINLAITLME